MWDWWFVKGKDMCGKHRSLPSFLINKIVSRYEEQRVSLAITISAVVLGSYSLTQATFDIGFWGLIHSFPITFFVALSLLTIASAILWPSQKKHGGLLCLQVCLLILSLWLLPSIVAGTPCYDGSFHSYSYWGNTDYILRHGEFSSMLGKLWYIDWPGAWIFFAIVFKVMPLEDPYLLIFLSPILFHFSILPFIYLFFKATIDDEKSNHRWAGIWLFYLGAWIGEVFLGAGFLGGILTFMMVALVARAAVTKKNFMGMGNRLILIVPLALLAITRLINDLVSLGIIAGLLITRRIRGINLILLGSLFTLAWLMYEVTSVFEGFLPEFVDRLLRVDLLMGETFVDIPSKGSEAHQAVATLRVLYSALVCTIGVAGIIITMKQRKISHVDTTVLSIMGGVILLAIFMGWGYGAELFHNIFLCSLPVIVYFGVKLLNYRKVGSVILCSLLIFMLPLCFIACYGNATIDHFSPSEVAAIYSFTELTDEGTVYGETRVYGKFRNAEYYDNGHLKFVWYEDGGNIGSHRFPCYLTDDRFSWAIAKFDPVPEGKVTEKDLARFWDAADIAPNATLFYSNPNVKIYACDRP